MFDPMAVEAQINRLGRVAPAMNMMALKGSDAAATGAALGRAPARGRVAVAAHNSVAASHERRRMKLAAGIALGQHQAASVT
jgi:hypothetical protein